MAFKMKGSPVKMGGIKGTSGHASALKQHAEASALKQAEASALKEGTDWWDKVKAAGGALYDNVGKVHGHGNSNSFSSNVAKSYGKKKKEYRKEAKESSNKMKSPMEQSYDNIAKIDHKEGTEENIKAHKENKTKTYKSDLSADEMNAKLAKTRHLASDKEEVTLPDPKKKYPKNEKEPKEKKKTYKKVRRTKLPKKKKTLNLVTGGYNTTYKKTGTSKRR